MWVAMWNCHSWPLDVSSNVKLPYLTVRCQYGWEGISESEHFIWKFGSQCALDLTMGGISWPRWALHLKTWPNLPVCFEWALIDNMDQWRVHLMSLTVLWGVYLDLVEHLIWKVDLILPSVSNGLSLTTWISEEFISCLLTVVLHTKDLMIDELNKLMATSDVWY